MSVIATAVTSGRATLAVEHAGAGAPLVFLHAGVADRRMWRAEVTALEIDRGIVPVLREVVRDCPNVTVVEGDAMSTDWPALLAGHDRWVVVANLPYNVATPLVCDLLDQVPAVHRMLVMVQREVAERFCGTPRTAAYGAVSVKVAVGKRDVSMACWRMALSRSPLSVVSVDVHPAQLALADTSPPVAETLLKT